MSLQVAILESSREVLRETLAPELADRLARSIVERASGRIDEAIGEFLGVEVNRDGKRRAGKLKTAGKSRNLDATELAADEPESDEGSDIAENTEAA
jgi:hypothetical protein